MRLGGPVFEKVNDPTQWVRAVRALGYSAAYCPVDASAGADVVRAYAEAAAGAGIVIAEAGAWSNPISRDDAERQKALSHCQAQLQLAEEIGARCCVNIAGSRGVKWDGPDASHNTPEVFDLIVESVRKIVDSVKPKRTVYALETMPWVAPDSADSYLALLKAIDRPGFGVHVDPVNLINSPGIFYNTAGLIRECFAKLGPWIRSCHGKDIALADTLTVHLSEVRPGRGGLDYRVFVQEIEKLGPQTPLMLEHLPEAREYQMAAEHVRKIAAEAGVLVL